MECRDQFDSFRWCMFAQPHPEKCRPHYWELTRCYVKLLPVEKVGVASP